MKTFRVTAPDGRVLNVQGDDPEGAAKAAEEYVAANPMKGVDAYKADQREQMRRADLYTQNKTGNAPEAGQPSERQAVNGFFNGATLGGWGQLEAALAAGATGVRNLAADVTGGKKLPYGMKDAYVGQRELDNADSRQFAKEHPVAAPAVSMAGGLVMPGAKGLGSVIAGKEGLTGVKAMLQGAGLLPRIARSVAVGAGLGGIAGAATADPGHELAGAGRGAVAGGAAGGAVPIIGAGASLIAEKVAAPLARTAVRAVNKATGGNMLDAGEQAAARLSEALRADGAAPDVIQSVVDDWRSTGAPPPKLLDIAAALPSGGQNTMRLLRAAASKGAGANVATRHLDQTAADLQDAAIGRTHDLTGPDTRTATGIRREIGDKIAPLQADAPNRILQDAGGMGVSPAAARGDVESLVRAGQGDASSAYAKARATPGGIWNDELHAIAQRPEVKTAIADATADLRNAGKAATHEVRVQRTVPVPGGGTRVETEIVQAPTAEAWDLAKKNLGRQVERDSFGRAVPDSHSQGNYNIGQANGALTKALRDAVPGYGEALDKAGDYLSTRSAFEQTKGALLDRTLPHADFERMWGDLTPAQQHAAQAGIANDIFDLAQNGKLQPGAFKAPSTRAKLETAFGPKATGFIDNLEHEASLAAGRPVQGATGDRGALSDLLGHSDALEHGLGFLNAKPDEFAAQLKDMTADARQTMKVGMRQAITDAIGKPSEGSTGLLNRLSTATNTRRNLSALLGDEEASKYMGAIQNSIDQLKNARFISPNTGSATATRLEDEGLVHLPPMSKTGLVLSILNKLKAGATLTDEERAALVSLGTGDADKGVTALTPSLTKAKRPAILPYFVPSVGAYAGHQNR